MEMETRENIMRTMEEKALIFKMALPMIFSVLVSSLYNIVDSIFIGKIGEKALYSSIVQAVTLVSSAFFISRSTSINLVWVSFIVSEVCMCLASLWFMKNISEDKILLN